jgi:hypothetical protein
MNGWHVCPSCGFNKHFEAHDGPVCNSCVGRGMAPEPATLVEYDFDLPGSRLAPRSLDGETEARSFEPGGPAWRDQELIDVIIGIEHRPWT